MVIPSRFGGVCMSGDSTVIGELHSLHYYMFLLKFKIIYSSASLWPWIWCTLQSVTSSLLTVKTQEEEGQIINSILKLDSWEVSGLPWLFLDTLNLSESAQTLLFIAGRRRAFCQYARTSGRSHLLHSVLIHDLWIGHTFFRLFIN